MTDNRPKGSFAKLMSSPAPVIIANGANFQKSSKPESQKTSNPELQNTGSGIPEIQISRNPVNQKALKRETYTKATYRLCDEALDAIEHTKRLLRRQYKTKVNLEEIAEEAIIAMYKDLLENKEKSKIIASFSGNTEIQKDGNPASNNS